MFVAEGGPVTVSLCQRRVQQRAQAGRAVRVALLEFDPCTRPTGGIDKMPNGTHASPDPLPASPVTSGLREDECTGPFHGLRPSRCHTSRQPGEGLQNTVK
jgi:hypothetical protein